MHDTLAAASPLSGDDDDFKPLTRAQAQALRTRLPQVSPWRVVGVQALAGLLVTGAVGLLTQSSGGSLSSLYGAAAAVIPQAVVARGMTRGATQIGQALVGFVVWEFAKVALAGSMLLAAPQVLPELSWPALLVAMVVSMKAGWLYLFRQSARVSKLCRV